MARPMEEEMQTKNKKVRGSIKSEIITGREKMEEK
jgi:hypothetical protein